MDRKSIHTSTPTLAVQEPRGLNVRDVAYCRSYCDQEPELRVTRSAYNANEKKVSRWDPRLWKMVEAGDFVDPNRVNICSFSGAVLSTSSLDSGWRLVLIDQSGCSVHSWDGRAEQETTYDLSRRMISVQEHIIGQEKRVVERVTFGDSSGDAASHNQCGQVVRHEDCAGTLRFPDYSLLASPLQEERQFLIGLERPDWPMDMEFRDNLLEAGQSYVTHRGFSAINELHSETDPKGNSKYISHAISGQISEIGLQLADAKSQRLTIVQNIRYNAFGQVEYSMAGNGIPSNAEYSGEDGRLTRLSVVSGDEKGQILHYFYDPMGNLLSIEDRADRIRHFNGQRIDPISRYRYDSLCQLIEATGREVSQLSYAGYLERALSLPQDANDLRNYTQRFRYDAAGNLLERYHGDASGFRMAVSCRSNRSLAQNEDGSLPDEESILKAFDCNGNQLGLQNGHGIGWDARNQLSRVELVRREGGGNDSEFYIYDHSGCRLRKVRTAQAKSRELVSEVRYLPGLEIHHDGEAGEERHVMRIEAGLGYVRVLQREAVSSGASNYTQIRYVATDHLGSSTLEFDEGACLVSQEGYYPFGGTAWWRGGASEFNYKTIRYSRKERDASGLYYYGCRYYAPWLSRWMNPDPGGDIDGLNLFRFVRNNPLRLVDEVGSNPYDFQLHQQQWSDAGDPVQAIGIDAIKLWDSNFGAVLEQAFYTYKESVVFASTVIEEIDAGGRSADDKNWLLRLFRTKKESGHIDDYIVQLVRDSYKNSFVPMAQQIKPESIVGMAANGSATWLGQVVVGDPDKRIFIRNSTDHKTAIGLRRTIEHEASHHAGTFDRIYLTWPKSIASDGSATNYEKQLTTLAVHVRNDQRIEGWIVDGPDEYDRRGYNADPVQRTQVMLGTADVVPLITDSINQRFNGPAAKLIRKLQ